MKGIIGDVICGTLRVWYLLYNLKNMKNTNGGMLILVKLQVQPATLLKLTLLSECFSRFLNFTNSTKSRNASQLSIRKAVQTFIRKT